MLEKGVPLVSSRLRPALWDGCRGQTFEEEQRMRRRLTILLTGMLALSSSATVNRLSAQEKKDAMPEPSVKVGDMAPDFTLKDTKGKDVSLHDFRGKKNVALAFYIFAFTGG